MQIVERIKVVMEEMGLNQSQLAERSGLSFGTVNRILNGKQDLKPNTLQKIAEGLSVSVADLDDRDLSFNTIVQGYLQFGDEITHITSYKQLLAWIQKYEPLINHLPNQVKTIMKEEKKNARKIVKTSNDIDLSSIDFYNEETYDATNVECWSFRKAEDEREGIGIDLGNMCVAYPFECNGRVFTNSEALYIAGMFSDNTPKCNLIQEELIKAKSGYDAKKSIRRKYEADYKREDWETFNVEYMKWCVWQKIKGNKAFQNVLLSIPRNAHIIENSTHQNGITATFWGAKNKELEEKRSIVEQWAMYENPKSKKKELQKILIEERNKINHVGIWQGINCMGKILKCLQLCLLDEAEPPINFQLLRKKKIYLFGELLTFE
ncbi:MAG: helix-turn-helix domain-containing protein [Bacteroidaceae bacterium]|nr:helix-turn-helix domain-containing protein [Bacteroidaceae bacterium]